MAPQTEHFVVETIHEGSDWAVRPASPEEVAEALLEPDEEWTMSLADARKLAAESAREMGCRWFDFSEEA